MAEPRVHEVPLSTDSSGEPESDSESRESRVTRLRPGPSAAGIEGTPEVARGRYVDVRLIANEERFKGMAWGEKYAGRYGFMNVDQADEEIAFLTEKVERLT